MVLIITLGLVATLVAVIFFDLSQMRIPNLLSIILIVLFVASAFALSPSEIGVRMAQAAIVFALGFFAFMFHLFGGGDVKILAALALFVPLEHAAGVLLVFSGTLIVGTIAVLLLRNIKPMRESNWAFLNTSQMPMGLPIGLAGIISVCGLF